MNTRGIRLLAAVLVLVGGTAGTVAQDAPEARLRAEIEPARGTVGDPLNLRLILDLPADAELSSTAVGPELGPFAVLAGQWQEAQADENGRRRVWRGRVAAYQTGDLELPAVRLELSLGGETVTVLSRPIPVRIESVLGDGEQEEIADIKDPVSLPPDFRALRIALAVLLGLLALSLGTWWLGRRFGSRFAARPLPADPFGRTPPHEWVYAALQELLDRRLAEQGQVTEFYGELAWIVKRYLGGRYRVDLMERTSAEVPTALRQAGAPEAPLSEAVGLLGRSDRVKFARELPDAAQCRSEIDVAYGIVDRTRPVEDETVDGHAETA